MWTDNETEHDFLNFGSVARTVAGIIVQAQTRPISIGVSGAWGVGKSSMIKLIRRELAKNPANAGGTAGTAGKSKHEQFIFVEFNAWLYQGYDDARAALIEVVAEKLAEEAEKRETNVEKTKNLLARVNWFRAIKLTAGTAASLALGLPPVGLMGEIWGLGNRVLRGNIDETVIATAETVSGKIGEATDGLILPKQIPSPPKAIHELRESLEEVLCEMDVTLVVLIDDLDRCLPETTISTLEAIRLLLFLDHTAFVIAADDQMIKHAVKRHFDGVDNTLVTNYFDKLIQVPIRVPPLGTQEVRAYMMLLFIENSTLPPAEKERLRSGVCEQLGKTWQGNRVDPKFLHTLNDKLPKELLAQLDAANRLAPFMANTTGVAGNPRLIKRFLNALSIRMAMSHAQGVGVDESELAKILLFERCGEPKAYAALVKAVTESADGKPTILVEWEKKLDAGETLTLDEPWNDPFITEWLRLPPQLGGRDLRGALYVSREHAPLITPEDRLSAEAADILTALLEHPDMAASLKDRLRRLSKPETAVIMDRLLGKAHQEQEWGVPPILVACLTVAEVDASQGPRLGSFLAGRPGIQIKPSIVPRISDQAWSHAVFSAWEKDSSVSGPVKKAIKPKDANGNIPVK